MVALFVASTAGLIARTILQRQLTNQGLQPSFAADLSFLVIPPILILLLFPIWRVEKPYILALFRRVDINWAVALRAVAIGALMRLTWWSQLIAGVSLGFYPAPEATPPTALALSFHCPPLPIIGLGFFVMALLVPLTEEILHRGYVQEVLRYRGAVVSVIVSAIVFIIFHRYTSWPFAFFAGVIFGMQFWISKSLWPSFISHATVNGLIQIDWRCMTGQWNPDPDSIPFLLPGIIAGTCLLASIIVLLVLIRGMATRTRHAPR